MGTLLAIDSSVKKPLLVPETPTTLRKLSLAIMIVIVKQCYSKRP